MRRRWETGRTEAFSDGVFAIAITLLVLDIGVPESEFNHLWRGIAHQWPEYLGFVTSFITIGGIWLGHHAIFRRLQYASEAVMRLNLALLMAVSFLPFPTRRMAEAIRNDNAERAALIFYGASLFLVSLLTSALSGAVVRDRRLLKSEVSNGEVNTITLAATPNTTFYLGATALALVASRASALAYLVIAIVSVARVRGDRPPDTVPERAEGRG